MTLEDLQRALREYLSTPSTPTIARVAVAALAHQLTTAISRATDADRNAERNAKRAHFAHERGDYCD